MESRIAPSKGSIDQPNKKSPTICQWIQTISGYGEQMLPTVAIEIVTFRNNATVFLKTGIGEISESSSLLEPRRGNDFNFVNKGIMVSSPQKISGYPISENSQKYKQY